MLKKLGKSITTLNVIAFTIVILVGGISIFLTKNILHNAYKVEELSRDMLKVDSIHADAYRLVLSIHHFLLEEDSLSSSDALQTLSQLEGKIIDYRNHEFKEKLSGKNLEIEQINIMLADIRELAIVKDLMNDFSTRGTYDKDKLIELEEFAYDIEIATGAINKIHEGKMNRWTKESLTNMWMILIIYLIFIPIGCVSIYIGHIILLRKVVEPIKELAVTTIEFAEGKLDKRVSTDSTMEVGQLYNSFNRMAERLQENDDILRKFNEALENKVQGRTIELREANAQLHKTQNALIRTEKVAAIGQIAAGVTHEVKNPLNSLSINTQMLLRDLSDKFGEDSSVYETATLIRYEINRINNILEEFVKFAKFPEPQFFENDINQVIQEVSDLMVENARGSEVTINLALQEGIPLFKFDARQFKEVIMNLCQNAINAIKESGSIDIESKMSKGNVIIHMSDTGEGISEKNLQNIFSPFFSTREGGMGLGLSIVQKIIESHGGKISCSSEVGAGTDFEIILLLERAQ
jgi:nitrogen fixation/metabolism regulation signal transduction histidine kinase